MSRRTTPPTDRCPRSRKSSSAVPDVAPGPRSSLAAVAYVVYRFWYGPAAAEAPNSALIGGGAALLIAVPGFWTGLPSVFAIGAIVLGLRSSGAKPKIGIALAVVALAFCALLAVVG